jgi:hypothetical protein
MSSVKATLAGIEYDIPMLNIGQLELVTDALAGPPMRATFAILKIALKRATPAVQKPDEIEATRDEVAAAVDAILVQAGFKEAKGPNELTPDQPGTSLAVN